MTRFVDFKLDMERVYNIYDLLDDVNLTNEFKLGIIETMFFLDLLKEPLYLYYKECITSGSDFDFDVLEKLQSR